MNTPNRPAKTPTISDEALILLYYGEADDPQLAIQVAQDPALRARFERLCATLACLDEVPVPESDSAQLALRWARLVPQLAAIPPARSPLQRLHAWLIQPRWSLASAASLLLVAVFSFWLGGRWMQPDGIEPDTLQLGAELALESYLTRHLSDAERWLSHLNNLEQAPDAQWTASLLRDNRIVQIRLQDSSLRLSLAQGNQLLPLLQRLEQELLIAANPGPLATAATANSQRHLQRLLFQLRVINQQWQDSAPNARGKDHGSTIRT